MAGQDVLWPLMPLESNKRNNSKVGLTCGDECGMESISFITNGWPSGAFAVLELNCSKWVYSWVGKHGRIARLHVIPYPRHSDDALVGLRQPTLDHGPFLKGPIELVDAECCYRLERRCANLASHLGLVAQDQLERALVFGTGSCRHLRP